MAQTLARAPDPPGPSPASHPGLRGRRARAGGPGPHPVIASSDTDRPRAVHGAPAGAGWHHHGVADEQQTPTGTATAGRPAPAVFRAVPTVALVAVAFLALCLSPIAFQGGPWFLLFLGPVAVGAWVVRSRTRVDEEGLHVRRVLGTRSVAWSELSGLRLPQKGWMRAVPTDGAELELRGVRIRDLGRIAEASGNRITAPTPAEAEAAAEHARELEAARMRVAKLRELQNAEYADQPDDEAAEHAEDPRHSDGPRHSEHPDEGAATDTAQTAPDEGAASDTAQTAPDDAVRDTPHDDGSSRRDA